MRLMVMAFAPDEPSLMPEAPTNSLPLPPRVSVPAAVVEAAPNCTPVVRTVPLPLIVRVPALEAFTLEAPMTTLPLVVSSVPVMVELSTTLLERNRPVFVNEPPPLMLVVALVLIEAVWVVSAPSKTSVLFQL